MKSFEPISVGDITELLKKYDISSTTMRMPILNPFNGKPTGKIGVFDHATKDFIGVIGEDYIDHTTKMDFIAELSKTIPLTLHSSRSDENKVLYLTCRFGTARKKSFKVGTKRYPFMVEFSILNDVVTVKPHIIVAGEVYDGNISPGMINKSEIIPESLLSFIQNALDDIKKMISDLS